MQRIEHQRITGQVLSVDEMHFFECTLVNCMLEYSGKPYILERTRLEGCRYVFFGRARGTIHFLQSVGLMDNGAERWSEHSDSVH